MELAPGAAGAEAATGAAGEAVAGEVGWAVAAAEAACCAAARSAAARFAAAASWAAAAAAASAAAASAAAFFLAFFEESREGMWIPKRPPLLGPTSIPAGAALGLGAAPAACTAWAVASEAAQMSGEGHSVVWREPVRSPMGPTRAAAQKATSCAPRYSAEAQRREGEGASL